MNEASRKTIEELDNLNFQILDLFDEVETQNAERLEEKYCYHVGSYGKQLRKLLDQYHENTRSKESKSLLKPLLLYYREIQQYLVYFVRFPSAVYQKNHPYLKELRELIEKKIFFLKNKFKDKAIQESMLFESDFKDRLEKTLNRRQIGNGN
jgi:hypothetical protein